MIRTILIAALLVPSLAHAELIVRKSSEVRPPAPKLASEPLTVDGMLDKIKVSYMSRMRRCYTKGLATDPSLAGTVTLTLTVNPYGRVSGEATGIAPKVDACISAAASTWRFPTATARKASTFRISLVLQQQ